MTTTDGCKDTTDDAIEILRLTHDGDALAPHHLKLVENAVNGFLNEHGISAFNDLLHQARTGYHPPWLHGVEHLTIDHQGHVYWKGAEVEHYDLSFAYSDRSPEPAFKLAERCRHLETIGVEITSENVIWRWDRFPNPKPR